jgi:hypothetical protein
MNGVLTCIVLAAVTTLGQAVPANHAPQPRPVNPDISLIMSHYPVVTGSSDYTRVLQIGFRNGKPLPAEVLYKCDGDGDKCLAGRDIRAGRYFVSTYGSVLDLREKKIINLEQEGVVVHTDDTKVTYWGEGDKREKGMYTFEYATGKRTHLKQFKLIPAGVPLSPDGTKALDLDETLTVYHDGKKLKTLGTDFKINLDDTLRFYTARALFPVIWLDNNRVLMQRKAGEIVIVNVDGKVTEVVTIKDVPEDAHTELIRDNGGSIIYSTGEKRFKIDLEKKTANPTDWRGLGGGFEATWQSDRWSRTSFRYNGKDIGELDYALLDHAVAAPGYLAVPHYRGACPMYIAVWSAASGEWTEFDHEWWGGMLGWVR